MGGMASQITSLTIVYSTVYSGVDRKKYQRSASLAFAKRIHRRPVNYPHKGPVTRKMFSFDDVIMLFEKVSWGWLSCQRHQMDTFSRYWSFVRGIHRSPVISGTKASNAKLFLFSLICARLHGWINNGAVGDLRLHRAHYDVTVMWLTIMDSDAIVHALWHNIYIYLMFTVPWFETLGDATTRCLTPQCHNVGWYSYW